MRKRRLIRFALISLLITGCAAGRRVIEVGGYDFDFEGQTYRIDSVNPRSEVGYNLLTRREGDESVVLGLDYDQDGSLDGVVEGQVPLERARQIYIAGIVEGQRLGRVRSKVQTEEFRIVINDFTYIVTTYKLALGTVFNKLTIMTAYYAPEVAVILDLEADGRLDTIEKGDQMLSYYQGLYEQVLDRGMRLGRVERIEGIYQVLPPLP
jgi:hypothetical protein